MIPMETLTIRGVRNINRSLIIYLVLGVFGLVVTYFTLQLIPYLDELTDPTVTPDPEVMEKFLPLIPSACGLVIVAIFGIILFLLGFWAMYRGRDEYGEPHRKDIDRAMLLFMVIVVVIIIEIGISVATSVIGLGAVSSTATSSAFQIVTLALGVISSLLIALFLFYLIKTFIPEEKSNLIILAVGLFSVAPIASLVSSAWFSPPSDLTGITFDPVWMIPGIISTLLSSIALILFILLYNQVHHRLKRHEIKPIWQQTIPGIAQQPQEMRWQPPPPG